MNYKGHLTLATASAVTIGIATVYYNIATLSNLKVIIPAIALGGLSSDLDTKSTPTKLYAGFMIIMSIYWYSQETYLYILMGIIPFLAAQFGNHRGWTHSYKLPIILFFTSSVAQYITYTMSIGLPDDLKEIASLAIKYELHIQAFAVGIVVHIIIDTISTFIKRRKKRNP